MTLEKQNGVTSDNDNKPGWWREGVKKLFVRRVNIKFILIGTRTTAAQPMNNTINLHLLIIYANR